MGLALLAGSRVERVAGVVQGVLPVGERLLAGGDGVDRDVQVVLDVLALDGDGGGEGARRRP